MDIGSIFAALSGPSAKSTGDGEAGDGEAGTDFAFLAAFNGTGAGKTADQAQSFNATPEVAVEVAADAEATVEGDSTTEAANAPENLPPAFATVDLTVQAPPRQPDGTPQEPLAEGGQGTPATGIDRPADHASPGAAITKPETAAKDRRPPGVQTLPETANNQAFANAKAWHYGPVNPLPSAEKTAAKWQPQADVLVVQPMAQPVQSHGLQPDETADIPADRAWTPALPLAATKAADTDGLPRLTVGPASNSAVTGQGVARTAPDPMPEALTIFP
ncbi:MAG: hypothetical protein WBA91_08120, partial [Paracoccaceae bacterium]